MESEGWQLWRLNVSKSGKVHITNLDFMIEGAINFLDYP